MSEQRKKDAANKNKLRAGRTAEAGDNKKSAYDVAAKYLSARMRTEHEVRARLTENGFDKSEAEVAIAELKALKYIDDYEYAFRYAEYAYEKKRVSRRILAELASRGVDGEIAKNALDDYVAEASVNERAIGMQIVKLEISNAKASELCDENGKPYISKRLHARIARKLESAGFAAGEIVTLLDGARGMISEE